MPVVRLCLIVMLLGLAPAARAELPVAVAEFRDEVFAQCREVGGTPAALDGFMTERDLNGDGQDDHAMNLHLLDCANAPGFFCGSAGCPVRVWTSGPQGHTVAWSGYAQEIVWDGPVMVAYLHGQMCTPPRAGFDGCEERIAFDAAQATAPAASEPTAAPAAPVAGRWTLRRPDNAPSVALVDGTGNIASLAAFCLGRMPWLAVVLDAPLTKDTIEVDFTFSDGTLSVAAQRSPASGDAYMIGLYGVALAERLGGRDTQVTLGIDGVARGEVSLVGSSRALRDALGACHDF